MYSSKNKQHRISIFFNENDIVNQGIFTFLLLFFCGLLHSQTSTLFTTDNQLSSSLINQVFQDSHGLIWIATENGLNRYDGAKFVQYKHHEGDGTTILNNYVRHIYENNDGVLFIGFLNGLQWYDYDTQRFHKIPMLLKNEEEIHPHVASILQLSNGIMLAGTGNGIFKIHRKNNVYVATKLYNYTSSDIIQQLFEDKQHNLWVTAVDKGLIRISPDNRISCYIISEENGSNLSGIREDANGNIFVGSLSHGLFRYSSKRDEFEPVNLINEKNPLPITTLAISSHNEIFIGTESHGMKIYNPVTNKIKELDPTIRKFDFSSSKVHSVIEDDSGNLWVAIYQRGVLLIPPKSNNFNYIGYQSVHNTISSTSVSAISKDDHGILWVGTDGDGIFALNPDGSLIKHYTDGPKSIITLYEDSQKQLWIGTYLSGLVRLDRKSGTFHYYKEVADSKTPLPKHIFSITEDNKSNLWIGTMGYGLYKLNTTNGKLYQMNRFSENNILHNRWINNLLYTDECLYIGTYYGLTSYNPETGYADYLPDNPITETKVIYTLFEDHLKNIWIGTSEGLYYKPNGKSTFIKYTEKDGLCNNIICALQEDSNGNLWVSTQHGISKLHLETNKFTNYYYSDGLQGNEFSRCSSFYDKQGNIYFGGINGITYFNPAKITNQGKIPNIKVTSLYLRNQEVTKDTKSGSRNILNSHIMESETISLAAEDNTFTIELATDNFTSPERLTYFYNLNKQDWMQLPTGANNITFNDLQPGTYSLTIKAREYETFSPEKTISIIISPPWYASATAKIIYAFLSVAICIMVWIQLRKRHRTREKIREERHQNQINQAKLEFFTNISHDIRTPISLITNPLKKLISTDQDPVRQKAYLLIKRNADKILQLINQLMDIRKIDKGLLNMQPKKIDMVTFLKDISMLFEDIRQEKNIIFEFNCESNTMFAMADPAYFDKVIQNVLSNAYKFTPENGYISVSISEIMNQHKTPMIQIRVQDNGPGIQPHEIEKVFNRFYQSNNQKDIEKGTGIGLHLARSIVHLHNGFIHAESKGKQQGSCFIIEIPKGDISTNELYSIQSNNVLKNNTIDLSGIEEKIYARTKYRVLIIDDDKDIREYLKRELAPTYHIATCEDGKEGFEHILQNMPDLIISDIKMPKMDGITVCKKVKQNININYIPVILLTAKSGEQDNIEGLYSGADAYLPKPFNLDILKNTIQNILQNRNLLKNTFAGNQLQEERLDILEMTSSDEKLIQRITDYVNENLNNPELNVEMITKEIGISRVHLYRKLKELTNQSARDFIKNIRLKQAGDLLANKKLSVQEVSYAIGYTNVSNFSTNFKEFYGVAPKFYSEKHLKDKEKNFENSKTS